MTVAPFWRHLDNFGDGPLNAWLLPRLFPGLGRYGSRADFVLYGIGSLLGNPRADANLRPHQRHLPRLVFSTGSYGPSPLPAGSHVFCVRGKFTCDALGIGHEHAVADGAILLPLFMRLTPRGELEEATVHKCEYAGPQAEAEFSTRVRYDFAGLLRHLLRFRRIRTHSLHAAIVADAYGVPWTPLRWERKWSDHFDQLGICGRPAGFALSNREALRGRQRELLARATELRTWAGG